MGEKNKTQLGFPPSSADKGLHTVCTPGCDPSEPGAARVLYCVQEDNLEGPRDPASRQPDVSLAAAPGSGVHRWAEEEREKGTRGNWVRPPLPGTWTDPSPERICTPDPTTASLKLGGAGGRRQGPELGGHSDYGGTGVSHRCRRVL